MKISFILAALFGFVFAEDHCPSDKERECITDVNHCNIHLM